MNKTLNAADSDAQLEAETIRKVTWRLVPFLMLCYLQAFIDRGNIGMAALQMNHDLGVTPKIFGFAGSLFFISYFIFEVPSNLALQKFGARKWIARIMVTWGLITASTALLQGQTSRFIVRFLLETDGMLGMRGWHWLFILEGIPTVLMGLVCLFYLTDRPEQARWLSNEQRNWLSARMAQERAAKKTSGTHLTIWQ